MTGDPIAAAVLAQARAYQTATARFGRGKEERRCLHPMGVPDPLAGGGPRNSPHGGYGTTLVLSHYVPVQVMAGSNATGTADSKRRRRVTIDGSGDNNPSWDNMVRTLEG